MESNRIGAPQWNGAAEIDDLLPKKRFTRRCVLGTIAGGLLAANVGAACFRWYRTHNGTTLVVNGPFSVGDYDPWELGLAAPKAIPFFIPELVVFGDNPVEGQSVTLKFSLSSTAKCTQISVAGNVFAAGKQAVATSGQIYSIPKAASQPPMNPMWSVSMPLFDLTVYLYPAKMLEITRIEWIITPS
jgi:hypothetical protein